MITQMHTFLYLIAESTHVKSHMHKYKMYHGFSQKVKLKLYLDKAMIVSRVLKTVKSF